MKKASNLVEVWGRLCLTGPIEILHVDKLVVILEAWVCDLVLWPAGYVGQVAEGLVAPVVERAEAGPGPALCV